MSPDAKKKHLQKRRKKSDDVYNSTEARKISNDKYRSSEKEAISRKNRNARSVAKKAVTRKQAEFDRRNEELQKAIVTSNGIETPEVS
jgi:hypothetical protein